MGSHSGGSYAVAGGSLRAKENAAAAAERVRQHDFDRLQARVRSGDSLLQGSRVMTQHSFTFTADELLTLRRLIGGEWLYVAGETLRPPDFETTDDVIVGGTACCLRVVCEIAEADFPYVKPTTYSVLAISDLVSGLEVAARRGNVYLQHQREQVQDIHIARETIAELENDKESWEYTTDVGVVFVLSHGAVAIVKSCHHTEMLVVRMAPSVDELDIPDCAIEWTDDLSTTHGSTRKFIPIDRLME